MQTLTESQRAYRRAEYSGKMSESVRPGTASSVSSRGIKGGKMEKRVIEKEEDGSIYGGRPKV